MKGGGEEWKRLNALNHLSSGNSNSRTSRSVWHEMRKKSPPADRWIHWWALSLSLSFSLLFVCDASLAAYFWPFSSSKRVTCCDIEAHKDYSRLTGHSLITCNHESQSFDATVLQGARKTVINTHDDIDGSVTLFTSSLMLVTTTTSHYQYTGWWLRCQLINVQ